MVISKDAIMERKLLQIVSESIVVTVTPSYCALSHYHVLSSDNYLNIGPRSFGQDYRHY